MGKKGDDGVLTQNHSIKGGMVPKILGIIVLINIRHAVNFEEPISLYTHY